MKLRQKMNRKCTKMLLITCDNVTLFLYRIQLVKSVSTYQSFFLYKKVLNSALVSIFKSTFTNEFWSAAKPQKVQEKVEGPKPKTYGDTLSLSLFQNTYCRENGPVRELNHNSGKLK